jgi:tetratricopeptide (TPR) repeat protein
MRVVPVLALPLLIAALIGCDRAGADRSSPYAPNIHLDSANALYIAGDHAGALARYQSALAADSTNAAAWYGIYMASSVLGDTAAAAAALLQTERLAPEAAMSEHPHPIPSPRTYPNPH